MRSDEMWADEENVYGKLKFFWDDQVKLRHHKESIEHNLSAATSSIAAIKARSDATSKANVKKARRLEKTVGELEAALADSLERMRPARIVDMTRSCIIYVLTADKDTCKFQVILERTTLTFRASSKSDVHLWISNLQAGHIQRNAVLGLSADLRNERLHRDRRFHPTERQGFELQTCPSNISIPPHHDQDIPSRIQQAQSAELPHLDSTAAQPVEEDKEEQRGHLSLNWQEKEIQQVPNVIWKNPEYEFLAFLYLDRNLISEIPDALSNMKYLEALSLSRNNIKIIPDYISKHTRLVTLALSFNQISEIPQAVGDLKYLQYLNLFSNLIKEIPMALHRCERLEDLNVGRNPLLSEEEVTGSSVLRIPQEILQRQKSGRGFDPRSFVKLLRMQERSTSK
uniref:PH domain-containing protein n=1 Tax=Guillardia theta TaxID=55529 RepID=A0A7S4HBZ2_GUITH|mmetsp:Transcript_13670/g.47417  ORF Transcript_13670/g.47417 Transcript_13670/m.47417 type:complete len:399 (+) Transcript_13670:324-1520(+)